MTSLPCTGGHKRRYGFCMALSGVSVHETSPTLWGGGAPRPHGEACTERHKGCCPDPQLSFHQRPHQLASHVREPSWVQNLWAAVDQPSQWCVGQGWSFSAKSALTVDSLARAVIIAVSSRYVLVWFVTQQWMNRAEGLV